MAQSKSKDGVLQITAPASDSPEDLQKSVESFPGYDDMTETEKSKLLEATKSLNDKGYGAPRMSIVRNEDGGYSMPGPADGGDANLYAMQLMQIFGTSSYDFTQDCLNDLVNYFQNSNTSGATELVMNSALAFIAGVKCQNETEALLAIQMVKTNDASGRALAMLGSASFAPALTATGNLANKLLRTNIAQMEALSNLRRGGEQVVRHIYVDNRGGQNIIAENLNTGSQNGKVETQAHATMAGPEMLSENTEGHGVPITGHPGKEKVPSARGQKHGRTERESEQSQARQLHGLTPVDEKANEGAA